MNVWRDVRVPTADHAVTLSADVYLPADVSGPVPALLTAVPYRKDLDRFYEPCLQWFARHGYACMLLDLRGVGASDGSPRPKNDPAEGDDLLEAMSWLASQEWCNGRLGVWGHSAGGVTTLRLATRQPPSLRAIIAMMCPLDPERDAFHHDGARVDLHQRVLWSGQMLLQQIMPPLQADASPETTKRWQQRLHRTEPHLLDLAQPPGHPAWRERVIDATAVKVPTFCVAGWRDLYAASMARAYAAIEAPKQLLVGPWGHTMPHYAAEEPVDFLGLAKDWWDKWLKADTTSEQNKSRAIIYAQGHDPTWLEAPEWPLPVESMELCAQGGKPILMPACDKGGPSEASESLGRYESDPTLGALSGLWGIPNPGLDRVLDQHDDDVRALHASSEPVQEDLLICGTPVVTLTLADEDVQRVERLVVRLTDVDADGRSRQITLGVVCPKTPLGRQEVVLRPTTYRMSHGHRLRLVISDADFPRLAPATNLTSFDVRRIRLKLPVVHRQVESFAPPRPSGGVRAERAPESRWTITRDLVSGQTEVGLAWSATTSVIGGPEVGTGTTISASVRRSSPATASTRGRHTARVRFPDGDVVEGLVEVECGRHAVVAKSELRTNGEVTYDRTWELPLSD